MKEGVVDLEGDVVVVVGVASEEEGAGVFVEWICYESHGTRDSSNNYLYKQT